MQHDILLICMLIVCVKHVVFKKAWRFGKVHICSNIYFIDKLHDSKHLILCLTLQQHHTHHRTKNGSNIYTGLWCVNPCCLIHLQHVQHRMNFWTIEMFYWHNICHHLVFILFHLCIYEEDQASKLCLSSVIRWVHSLNKKTHHQEQMYTRYKQIWSEMFWTKTLWDFLIIRNDQQ